MNEVETPYVWACDHGPNALWWCGRREYCGAVMNGLSQNRELHRPYEIKPGQPNTPLWDVYRDGVKLQDFTSRTAAQACVDHLRKLEKREQSK